MKDKYEVGYGKPPKATRFGNRPQPDRLPGPRRATEAGLDLAASINGPMKVFQRGATVRVHPHEAMMLGLAKKGLDGSIRAIKEFFLECKKAGLLEAPPLQQTGGFILAPKGVPSQLAARIRTADVIEAEGAFTLLAHRRAYLGCILIAPSNRITSPFNISFSIICFASAAYSSGRPSRDGNGTC